MAGCIFFFFKQKTAYEMRISDWSSDVCSSDLLDGLSDLGSINDVYRQDGENWALFTHNIFHITDKLDFTFGLRYTNDKKKFSASFTNDNPVCTTAQGLVLDDLLQPEVHQGVPNNPDDTARADRQSVLWAKRVSIRVDHV